MQIGIFAKTFAATGAEPVLQAVRAAGFGAAQFNFACLGLPSMPDDVPPQAVKDVTSASASTGIAIAAISGTYNMIHPDPAERSKGLRRLARIIESAPAMGTTLVTLCTGTRDALDQWRAHPDNITSAAWDDLTAEMAKVLEAAERAGVDVGVEPELANVVSSAALARKLIGEMGSKRLRIVLDPANLFERASVDEARSLVASAVDLLGDRIAMAHAKDRRADGTVCAAGAGMIDFTHFVRCLGRAGFDGPLVTHGLSEAEAPAVAEYLKRVIEESAAS